MKVSGVVMNLVWLSMINRAVAGDVRQFGTTSDQSQNDRDNIEQQGECSIYVDSVINSVLDSIHESHQLFFDDNIRTTETSGIVSHSITTKGASSPGTSSPGTTKESVSPCTECVESEGAYFGADGGHLQMVDSFDVGRRINISLEIKPGNLSGVLLAVRWEDKTDFLLLQMIDGTIKFSVDNGIGIISASFNSPYVGYLRNGEWHIIVAEKSKNVVTLTVDGERSKPSEGPTDVKSADTDGPLFVGGVPEPSQFRGLETRAHYVGCIRKLQINQELMSLQTARISPGSVFRRHSETCPTA